MARGRLLVLEGGEGVGKSTQLQLLHARLVAAGHDVLSAREPGGTPLGDEVRALLLDSSRTITPRAEALLFMASRAQLVECEIAPALTRGVIVLIDRFFLSTYAYQVVARGLPEEEVRCANALATAGIIPDVTIVLTVPQEERARRTAARATRDRIEDEDRAFHGRVERAFAEFLTPAWQKAHPECGAIVAVDGTGEPAHVAGRVATTLAARWPESFAALADANSC